MNKQDKCPNDDYELYDLDINSDPPYETPSMLYRIATAVWEIFKGVTRLFNKQ